MRTKKEFYKMGILSMVERAGGKIQMLEQIKEAQKQGTLSNKQAYDLRDEVNKACCIDDCLVTNNELIEELDKKVKEAVKYYR